MNTLYFIHHFRQKTLFILFICMFILAASYTCLSYNQLHNNVHTNLKEKANLISCLASEHDSFINTTDQQWIDDIQTLLHVRINIIKNNAEHEALYTGFADNKTEQYSLPIFNEAQQTIAYLHIRLTQNYHELFHAQWTTILLLSLLFVAAICLALYLPLGKIQQSLNQHNGNLEETVLQRTEDLEQSNDELKSFAYSVSHDLRGPLRAIDGFSLALEEDYHDQLDDGGKDFILRIRQSTQRMGTLIDAILILSRVSQVELHYFNVNLSQIAQQVVADMQAEEPENNAIIEIQPDMIALGDPTLLRQAIENLLSNAFKFTRKQSQPQISFRCSHKNGQTIYAIKDNGVGFNQAYEKKLFTPFQRLHKQDEFEGTGIGLPIVQRIIHRHGGIISAESAIDKGAVFYFNLPTDSE